MRIRLGVNIDHVATLRQLRGGLVSYPDIERAAQIAVTGGADQITIHLRQDRRHIQESDLALLTKQRLKPINLEMAVTSEMIGYALQYKPNWVCLVPENRAEITTEGGLEVALKLNDLRQAIPQIKEAGIKVSMFIEPDLETTRLCHELNADAVEFHTGRFSLASGGEQNQELERIKKAFTEAKRLGLGVHAGHGLDEANIAPLLKLPELEEVNIGHSIICRSVFVGLKEAVHSLRVLLDQARQAG